MAALATQHIVAAGTAPTYSTPAVGGDTAEIGSGRDTFLHVKNSNAGTCTVTISSDLTLDSGADYPDKSVAVLTATEAWIPLIKDYADDAAGAGRCTVSTDVQTDVEIAVVRRN